MPARGAERPQARVQAGEWQKKCPGRVRGLLGASSSLDSRRIPACPRAAALWTRRVVDAQVLRNECVAAAVKIVDDRGIESLKIVELEG